MTRIEIPGLDYAKHADGSADVSINPSLKINLNEPVNLRSVELICDPSVIVSSRNSVPPQGSSDFVIRGEWNTAFFSLVTTRRLLVKAVLIDERNKRHLSDVFCLDFDPYGDTIPVDSFAAVSRLTAPGSVSMREMVGLAASIQECDSYKDSVRRLVEVLYSDTVRSKIVSELSGLQGSKKESAKNGSILLLASAFSVSSGLPSFMMSCGGKRMFGIWSPKHSALHPAVQQKADLSGQCALLIDPSLMDSCPSVDELIRKSEESVSDTIDDFFEIPANGCSSAAFIATPYYSSAAGLSQSFARSVQDISVDGAGSPTSGIINMHIDCPDPESGRFSSEDFISISGCSPTDIAAYQYSLGRQRQLQLVFSDRGSRPLNDGKLLIDDAYKVRLKSTVGFGYGTFYLVAGIVRNSAGTVTVPVQLLPVQIIYSDVSVRVIPLGNGFLPYSRASEFFVREFGISPPFLSGTSGGITTVLTAGDQMPSGCHYDPSLFLGYLSDGCRDITISNHVESSISNDFLVSLQNGAFNGAIDWDSLGSYRLPVDLGSSIYSVATASVLCGNSFLWVLSPGADRFQEAAALVSSLMVSGKSVLVMFADHTGCDRFSIEIARLNLGRLVMKLYEGGLSPKRLISDLSKPLGPVSAISSGSVSVSDPNSDYFERLFSDGMASYSLLSDRLCVHSTGIPPGVFACCMDEIYRYVRIRGDLSGLVNLMTSRKISSKDRIRNLANLPIDTDTRKLEQLSTAFSKSLDVFAGIFTDDLWNVRYEVFKDIVSAVKAIRHLGYDYHTALFIGETDQSQVRDISRRIDSIRTRFDILNDEKAALKELGDLFETLEKSDLAEGNYLKGLVDDLRQASRRYRAASVSLSGGLRSGLPARLAGAVKKLEAFAKDNPEELNVQLRMLSDHSLDIGRISGDIFGDYNVDLPTLSLLVDFYCNHRGIFNEHHTSADVAGTLSDISNRLNDVHTSVEGLKSALGTDKPIDASCILYITESLDSAVSEGASMNLVDQVKVRILKNDLERISDCVVDYNATLSDCGRFWDMRIFQNSELIGKLLYGAKLSLKERVVLSRYSTSAIPLPGIEHDVDMLRFTLGYAKMLDEMLSSFVSDISEGIISECHFLQDRNSFWFLDRFINWYCADPATCYLDASMLRDELSETNKILVSRDVSDDLQELDDIHIVSNLILSDISKWNSLKKSKDGMDSSLKSLSDICSRCISVGTAGYDAVRRIRKFVGYSESRHTLVGKLFEADLDRIQDACFKLELSFNDLSRFFVFDDVLSKTDITGHRSLSSSVSELVEDVKFLCDLRLHLDIAFESETSELIWQKSCEFSPREVAYAISEAYARDSVQFDQIVVLDCGYESFMEQESEFVKNMAVRSMHSSMDSVVGDFLKTAGSKCLRPEAEKYVAAQTKAGDRLDDLSTVFFKIGSDIKGRFPCVVSTPGCISRFVPSDLRFDCVVVIPDGDMPAEYAYPAIRRGGSAVLVADASVQYGSDSIIGMSRSCGLPELTSGEFEIEIQPGNEEKLKSILANDRFSETIAATLSNMGYQVDADVPVGRLYADFALRKSSESDDYSVYLLLDRNVSAMIGSDPEGYYGALAECIAAGYDIQHVRILDWVVDPQYVIGRIQSSMDQ